MVLVIAGSDNTPLAQVQALRFDLADLTPAQIDERLCRLEQSLQRRLSVIEAAILFKETPANIYKAVERGNLPAKFEGARNSPSFVVADLQRWVQRPRRRHAANDETGCPNLSTNVEPGADPAILSFSKI